MKIYAKIAQLQAAVRGLSKDAQAYGYGYVSGDKVLSVVRPLMDDLGLLLMPSVEEVNITPTTYDQYDRKAQAVLTKTENLTVLSMMMTWIDVETGETLPVKWAGVGQNGYDKGYGSALTYAERYYLLKTLHIATDEDDVDAVNAVRDRAIEEAAKATAAPAPAPQGPRCATIADLQSDQEFWAWARAAAAGKNSKHGVPAREAFRAKYRPTPEQLDYYDGIVRDLQAAQPADNDRED